MKTIIDEKEPREDVRENLPDGWKLRVFKVTSSDSGKEYWVQHLVRLKEDGTPWAAGKMEIMLCDCPEGKFKQPLTVLGLKDFWCKHAQLIVNYIKDENARKGGMR